MSERAGPTGRNWHDVEDGARTLATVTTTPTADSIPKADGAGKLAAGWISEVLALADLSDVTAKTGTGTTVVMSSSPAVTTPNVTGSVKDANANVIVSLSPQLGAVNYVEVANAGAGSAPSVASAGTDAAVDLLLVAKGAGVVKADGVEVVTISGTQTLTNKSIVATQVNSGTLDAARLPAATTTTQGAVILATDGETTATEAVAGSDSRLGSGIELPIRVWRSALTTGGSFLTISNTAYFVFVGRVLKTVTPKYVEMQIRTSAAGAQTAELGLFSSANPPNKGNLTMTKLEATGTIDSLTAASGTVVRNTSAFTTGVAAGTYLWAGFRNAMDTTQVNAVALSLDMAQGYVQTLAGAGALTAAGPFAATIPATVLTAMCPDLRVVLD